jgi:membrane-bound ClpP family serine protease
MSSDAPKPTDNDPTIVKLLRETRQSPQMRRPLLDGLQGLFDGRLILVYFTSFSQPVIIDDADADIIEGVLQKSDTSKGLSLVINSAGGSGLAAERIINICRSYAKVNFEVIVPKMAKSAATMICFGARKIWMSQTSELGPIDPQVRRGDRVMAAYDIVTSYKELLQTSPPTTYICLRSRASNTEQP